MYKIGVLGDKDSIMGFRALGLDTVICQNGDEAKEALSRMDDYAIVYITEQLIAQIGNETEKYKSKIYPAVIPIPNNSGTLGIGMDNVKKNVERAVGADIMED